MSWRDSGIGTSLGNLIIAGKEGDYTSGANADSFFALNTTLNNSRTEKLRLTSDGRLGIHTNAPAAKLHIEQSNNSGGIPVLTLDQADVSEQFLKLIGSSTTDNTQSLVDAANLATPGSIVGWFKTYVEDVQATNPITGGDYWVPFYNTPTS